MFKGILSAFRTITKPGVGNWNDPAPLQEFSRLGDNNNSGALVDGLGSQWIRDAGAPVAYFDPSNSSHDYPMMHQTRSIALGVAGLDIGQYGLAYLPTALFSLGAISGDPATAWNTAPVYLQLFVGSIVPAGAPDFVLPVARSPEVFFVDFGIRTPFNGVAASVGGVGIYFSSTRDTYTAGPTGAIMANWAFYSKPV